VEFFAQIIDLAVTC